MPEQILLFGSFSEMLSQLAAYLAQRKLLEDRDLGSWIGYPIGDYAKAYPLGRKLYFQLFSQKEPPFRPEPSKDWKIAGLSVPEPKQELLSNWKGLKDAIGGSNGFTFGRWRTTVVYKGGRQSVVQGATKEVSIAIASRLASLSSLEVAKISTTETKPIGRYSKGQPLEIKNIQIYPGSFYVLESKNWTGQQKGKDGKPLSKTSLLEKDVARRRIPKIALWTGKPPKDYTERLKKMLNF